MALHAQSQFHHVIGLGEGGGHGGVPVLPVLGAVPRGHRHHGLGRERVEHHRELLDLHHHGLGGVLGEVGVLGEDGRDGLAHVADLLDRQHRLQAPVGLVAARHPHRDRRWAPATGLGEVVAGQDRGHAGLPPGVVDVDGHDAAVGDAGPHQPQVQLVAAVDVVGEPAVPAQQARVLVTGDPDPDRPAPAVGGARVPRAVGVRALLHPDPRARPAAGVGRAAHPRSRRCAAVCVMASTMPW